MPHRWQWWYVSYLLNAIASVILGNALPWAALELILATHQPLSTASPFAWFVRLWLLQRTTTTTITTSGWVNEFCNFERTKSKLCGDLYRCPPSSATPPANQKQKQQHQQQQQQQQQETHATLWKEHIGTLEHLNIWTLDHWKIQHSICINLHLVTSIALILFMRLRVTLVTV